MGILNLISSGRRIILLPVLTRYLGVVQFGVYSQFMVFVQFLTPFATLNVEAGILRFLAGKKKFQSTVAGYMPVL